MTAGVRKPGDFCWINMITPAPDGARDFFGTLLGWTFFEMPGVGHGIKVGGVDVGGVYDIAAPGAPPTRPYIGTMVKVANADATVKKVVALGGKGNAMDLFDRLRMANCTDPLDARFDGWEDKKARGTEVDTTAHGAPGWFEMLTPDVPRSTKFYSELFGWTPKRDTSTGMDYTSFSNQGEPVAGMMQITPEMGAMPAQWLTYFTVNDVDAAARDVVKLGGKITMKTKVATDVGRFCCAVSPQGVMFYLITYQD